MSASNVCQYFIQGKCRFGAKCRNYHPGTQANVFNSLTGRPNLSNNLQRQQHLTKPGYNQFALLTDGDSNLGNWHGSSTNDSNTAGRSTGANIFNTASRHSSSDTAALNPFLAQHQVEDMSEDDVPNMENIKSILRSDAMELSNCPTLWPLTSYSPIGGISMFPEFEDLSAEEIRWEYCVAHSNNSLQEYAGRLQELIMKRKALISQLSTINGEDLNNRLMSAKDKLLSVTSPVVQNPVPQSNDKPLMVISSPSQPSAKTTKPVTTTISATVKPSSQAEPTTSSSGALGIKTSSASPTKEDMDAFKADKFTLGKIPTCAPPPELC